MNKQEIIKSILENPMDRERWINAGKACGWNYCKFHSFAGSESEAENCHDCSHDGWCKNALHFHEISLVQSWDAAVEWLNNLIK